MSALIAHALLLSGTPGARADLPPCNSPLFASSFEDLFFGSTATQGWSAQAPDCNEQEGNSSFATANILCASQQAAIQATGDLDYFYLFPAGDRYLLTFETWQTAPASCPAIDTVVTLYDFEGIPLASDDDTGAGSCSQLVYAPYPPPVSPTLYIRVEEFESNAAIAQYGLTYTMLSLWRNEVEPNGSLVQANPMCDGYYGQIGTVGDIDFLQFFMVAGSTLTVQTNTGFSSLCQGGIDTYLELFDSVGTSLASDDDSGPDACSLLTYTTPIGISVRLMVTEFGNNAEIPFYGLALAYTEP